MPSRFLHPEHKEAVLQWLKDHPEDQCSTRLRVENCFCIEGVFCEVYRQLTGIGKWTGKTSAPQLLGFEISYPGLYEWEEINIPLIVREFYFGNKNPVLIVTQNSLQDGFPLAMRTQYLNDTRGLKFEDFYRLIEDQM